MAHRPERRVFFTFLMSGALEHFADLIHHFSLDKAHEELSNGMQAIQFCLYHSVAKHSITSFRLLIAFSLPFPLHVAFCGGAVVGRTPLYMKSSSINRIELRMLPQAQAEAQRVFAAVLARAAESERIRSSLALLKQYDSLFRLPPRIRDATKRCDHEQVGATCFPLRLHSQPLTWDEVVRAERVFCWL